jgi:hypothetical protein
MCQIYPPTDTVNQCIKNYIPEDTVNQCVKFIYQKTQSTNVSNLSTRRHSQPMCQIHLPKDTVNQCVNLSTNRHSQPMCPKYKRCSEPKHQIDLWKLNLCAFL